MPLVIIFSDNCDVCGTAPISFQHIVQKSFCFYEIFSFLRAEKECVLCLKTSISLAKIFLSL